MKKLSFTITSVFIITVLTSCFSKRDTAASSKPKTTDNCVWTIRHYFPANRDSSGQIIKTLGEGTDCYPGFNEFDLPPEYDSFRFWIYNRWGELQFENSSTNTDHNWICNNERNTGYVEGTYFYVLNLHEQDSMYQLSGTVTVLCD